MMANRYTKYAPRLAQLGYDTTPVSGKRPILTGWTDRPSAARDYAAHGDHNIGVLCGGFHNIVAIDVDVMHVFCSNQIKKLIDEFLGTAPRRVGLQPKFLMVFRTDEPMRKMKTGSYFEEGQEKPFEVELLAEGQQFVASGIHPDTNKPYAWPEDNLMAYRADHLTLVTQEQVRGFLDACAVVLSRYGELKGRKSQRSIVPTGGLNLTELDGEIAEIETALGFLPNDDEHYDTWIQTLHALKGALGDDGYDLAHRWSERSEKYDPQETDRAWDSIKNVNHIGAGSIFHWAKDHGFDLREAREPQFVGPSDIVFEIEDQQLSPLIRASEIRGPIPKREWLLDQWFPTKAVSALFGQGGVGKTLLIHQLANCVATGAPFMGLETKKMPVLMVLCEDDADEISRRQLSINAWRQVNEITETGPEDLYIWPRVGEENILVTFPSQGEDKAGEFFGQLCEQVEAVKGEEEELLVIIDTTADTFGGNENIRREVNTYIKTYLGSFSKNYNATVIMLAHPSMSGMSSGTGMSGSTAWENSVRARAYFSRADDADDVRYLSRKKSNYSQSGDSTNITLVWDEGVYQIPQLPNQLDKIENRALKNRIINLIKQAEKEGNPFRQRTGRKIAEALPALLAEKKQKVMKLVSELEISGEIIVDRRVGYIGGKTIGEV